MDKKSQRFSISLIYMVDPAGVGPVVTQLLIIVGGWVGFTVVKLVIVVLNIFVQSKV